MAYQEGGRSFEWINPRRAMYDMPPKEPPRVDKAVSEAVGGTVYVNNQTVIKKVLEWKKRKNANDDRFDNYLKDPAKIKELKQALNIQT